MASRSDASGAKLGHRLAQIGVELRQVQGKLDVAKRDAKAEQERLEQERDKIEQEILSGQASLLET